MLTLIKLKLLQTIIFQPLNNYDKDFLSDVNVPDCKNEPQGYQLRVISARLSAPAPHEK